MGSSSARPATTCSSCSCRWTADPDDGVGLGLPAAAEGRAAAPSARRATFCEFKGAARYYDAGDRPAVAWSYALPGPGFEAIAGCYAFYPGRVDRATVDGEAVEAQPGDFYGGWITSAVRGPFKGGPGTAGW